MVSKAVTTAGVGRAIKRFAALLSPLLLCGCDSKEAFTEKIDRGAFKVEIDPRRSLVVTEQPILARFPFQRLMEKLVADSGVRGLTALGLYQQWWDTQNPGPSLGLGPNCDSQRDGTGQPVVNGYPYDCRPAEVGAEGLQAFEDPFAGDPETNPAAYFPVGLFNRFDTAPGDGSHCGQYRVAYARRSGVTESFNRNLVIFEAAMPNPQPGKGLDGCRKIVKFWADLSKQADLERRAEQLERFYFDGIDDLPPAVHADHFGNNPRGPGQLRTNQFMQPESLASRAWMLREFKLVRACAAREPERRRCTLQVIPTSVKVNPFGPLFSPAGGHAQAAAFHDHFASQVPALAAPSLTDIDFQVPDLFNTGQSKASGSDENRYLIQFGPGPSPFHSKIAERLAALGSTLSPQDVVARAQALSCAGCHRLNNNLAVGGGLIWPPSLGFTHVNERVTEVVDGVRRYPISGALTDVFLPHRQRILGDFLSGKAPKTKQPGDPIGGASVH